MASIQFTDATGSATLTNSKPSPANRFTGWTPSQPPYGPAGFAVGTGLRYMFHIRTDNKVSFELVGIPRSSMSVMLRLQRHLLFGGTVTVNTQDTSNRSYTCGLGEDGEVSIELSDTNLLEYTMRFSGLLNTASTQMICLY